MQRFPSRQKVGSEEAKNEYVEVQIVTTVRVSNGQLSVNGCLFRSTPDCCREASESTQECETVASIETDWVTCGRLGGPGGLRRTRSARRKCSHSRTRCEGWVGLVVVSLDVCICHRLVQARDDRLDRERWLMGQSIRKDVTCRDFDSLLKKIVFQHDETAAHSCSIADNVFPILQHLLYRNRTSVNIEVTRIKSGSGTDACPDDGCQAHRD